MKHGGKKAQNEKHNKTENAIILAAGFGMRMSIIAAFPIGMVIVLITASFLKDASAYLKELENKNIAAPSNTAAQNKPQKSKR